LYSGTASTTALRISRAVTESAFVMNGSWKDASL